MNLNHLGLSRLASATLLLFAATEASASDYVNHADAMVSWLKAEKGIFNDKVETRKADPNEAESRYGIFANDLIKEGEIIFEIPRSIIVSTGKPRQQVALECDMVRILKEELEKGDDSKYAPYVNYLQATQAPKQLPSAWSEDGKQLLMNILGYGTDEPLDPIEVTEWFDECAGFDDPMGRFATQMVIQRAWDNVMIPIYDNISHRNGDWFNTACNDIEGDEPIRVTARRDIEAGEEIYGSYNLCEDCTGRLEGYGTQDIFRDYGFIEEFPQRWIFPAQNVVFDIDEIYEDGKGTGKYYLKSWESSPDSENIDELRDRIDTLKEDMENFLSERDPNVPEYEWNSISEFANAMVFAASFAIDAFEKEHCPEGNCKVMKRYENLDDEVELFAEEQYTKHTCDHERVFQLLDEEPYEELETIDSQYQQFTFFWNKETKATCFDIENTVQICDDYRPHYHEMSVHYSARYLANPPKRVLFVGGGDSLLLHEVLKYPSLELVVGLEIDQKVVRYSFKHFGSQPHFENEKVQWWFGDASKSLLMLPREYFGSFDLVLIDLSETVASFAVTEKLDILGALALLVKPDGIILKNEVYFKPFAKMNKYSVAVLWYDNPIICAQVMSMGSDTIDFLNPTLTDYNVDTLFLQDLNEIDDPFELYHDYAKNTTSAPTCYTTDDEATTQVGSPGILLILEAENTAVDLANVDALKDILTGALEGEGLTVVATDVVTPVDRKAFVSIILREGYVVARTEPEHNYCGFDIHFWSSFHKQEGVKRALLAAVQGDRKTSSAFRIIAGGMFGVSTWKDDEKRRGPSTTEGCDTSVDTVEYKAKQSSINSVTGEITKLIDGNALKVAVLCGDDMATCESNSNALKENGNIGRVVNLSCPMMKDFNEFGEDANNIMYECGENFVETVKTSLAGGRFNVLIIDSTANKFVASVLLKAIIYKKNFDRKYYDIFEKEKTIILSAMANESDEWRRNFLKKFKEKTFHFDPAVYAEVALYGSTDDDFKLLFVCEDDNIVNDLKDLMPTLEKKSGLKSDIEIINGGMYMMQDNFKASHPYSPKDYDQTSPLEQWKSQQPIALQVVSQMETEAKGSITKEVVRDALDRALTTLSAPTRVSTDENINVQEFAGLGDGCVFMATWSGGSIFVLWDGREHVDVNLFAYEKLESQVKEFEESFQKESSLKTMLYDEHPRGFGRVVSYKHEFVPGDMPHWVY